MPSAYENAMSNEQANNYTQQYPVVTHEVIMTPFQVAMDCKHVPEQADHICWNCTIKIIDMAEKLEAERDMYKQGFDALTTANEQIVRERDEARKKNKELVEHQVSIIMALYAIDKKAFGPLTVKEGIAELVKQRDEARRALAQAHKTLECIREWSSVEVAPENWQSLFVSWVDMIIGKKVQA